MTIEQTPRKPLRLWPGVATVVPQWLALIVFTLFVPEGLFYGIIAGLVGGLVVAVWWLFFSRAPWLERVGALLLMPIAMIATSQIVHPSIANAGMGRLLPIFAIPVLSLALVTGRRAVAASRTAPVAPRWSAPSCSGACLHAGSHGWDHRHRQVGLAMAVDADTRGAPSGRSRRRADGTRARSGGRRSSSREADHCRAATPRQLPRRLRPGRRRPVRSASTGDEMNPPSGRGFGGPSATACSRRADRNGLVQSPPVAVVAPADRTGLVVVRGPRRSPLHPGAAWRRRDRVLLQPDHRRAGVDPPRRGPVLGVEWRRRSARDADAQQRSRLLAWRDRDPERARRRNGAVIWSRNAATDTGAKVPVWGFASSPLVVDDLVDRRRLRPARRLRRRHRQAALVRPRPAAGATARRT